jgi:hypothetical protein
VGISTLSKKQIPGHLPGTRLLKVTPVLADVQGFTLNCGVVEMQNGPRPSVPEV